MGKAARIFLAVVLWVLAVPILVIWILSGIVNWEKSIGAVVNLFQ